MSIIDYIKNISIEKKIEKDDITIDSEWKKIVEDKNFDKNDFWMREWYLRLREKYKHDRSQLLKIIEDWGDYLYHKKLFFNSISAMGGGDEDGSMNDTINESVASQFEIENRFASLLSVESVEWLKDLETRRYGIIKK